MKKIKLISLLVALFFGFNLQAQKADSKEFTNHEYWEVVSGRAAKIVETMNLGDEGKEKRVQDLIAAQYYRLNGIQDGTDAKIDEVKELLISKEKKEKTIGKLNAKRDKELAKLHKSYLKSLSNELTPDQVDEVKNGMTYGVLVNTYAGYQDMLPNLTDEQKKFILDALTEAREKAMDAGSSKDKHAWFGKYKGRINNYLSKQGYDLNKESKDWHERLRKEGKTL
ncbi:DUF3826 domain-containing protein [Mangrovibacterium sp.]|uniref:DUF3826 domain-containing protein n=1 Tax=Mangrovibacterium sp. TaxID=1961364 RepID=UPI00356B0584